jgi:hypothetical protein
VAEREKANAKRWQSSRGGGKVEIQHSQCPFSELAPQASCVHCGDRRWQLPGVWEDGTPPPKDTLWPPGNLRFLRRGLLWIYYSPASMLCRQTNRSHRLCTCVVLERGQVTSCFQRPVILHQQRSSGVR